jgi:hypothetical protein
LLRADFLQHGQLTAAGNENRRPAATKKCDEFPSPHDVARAKDYIGHEEDITFLDRELCRSLHPSGPRHVRFES